MYKPKLEKKTMRNIYVLLIAPIFFRLCLFLFSFSHGRGVRKLVGGTVNVCAHPTQKEGEERKSDSEDVDEKERDDGR